MRRPGAYAVRVCVAEIDHALASPQEIDDPADRERYLDQLWPAETWPERVVKRHPATVR